MTGEATEVAVTLLDAIPPGEGRVFEILGRRVALFHTRAGKVFAVQAACPHRGGPLADGLVGDGVVICPLHGRKYDLATGKGIGTDCSLASYPVRVDAQGRISVSI